jgi:hypothetical protein
MNGLQSCKPHLKYLPCKADTTALECGWHAVRDNALDLGFLIWIEGLGFRWTADSKRCRSALRQHSKGTSAFVKT